MTARSAQDPEGRRPAAIPRDLPDQQAGQEEPEDDVARTLRDENARHDEELPDTDEAGSGPRGRTGRGEDGNAWPEPVEPTD